jgi:GNAT superfamily N-acetyltransferase
VPAELLGLEGVDDHRHRRSAAVAQLYGVDRRRRREDQPPDPPRALAPDLADRLPARPGPGAATAQLELRLERGLPGRDHPAEWLGDADHRRDAPRIEEPLARREEVAVVDLVLLTGGAGFTAEHAEGQREREQEQRTQGFGQHRSKALQPPGQPQSGDILGTCRQRKLLSAPRRRDGVARPGPTLVTYVPTWSTCERCMLSAMSIGTLRIATPEDADAVTRLLQRSYPELMRASYDDEVLTAALPLITSANPTLLASGTFYLVEFEGEVEACGGWTPERPPGDLVASAIDPDGAASSVAFEGEAAHLRHFATDPAHTGRGLGREIVERCLADARARGLARFECLSSLNAEPFYARLGFERLALVQLRLTEGVELPSVYMRRSR